MGGSKNVMKETPPEGADAEDKVKVSRGDGVPDRNNVASCFFNIKTFVIVCCIIGILLATDTMLRFALLTTLERRFRFKTVENGIIIAAYDVGHVILLLVLSYVGPKIHKPRTCAVGGFLAVIAGGLWALPHFLFGSGIKASSILVQNKTDVDLNIGLCMPALNGSILHDHCMPDSNSSSASQYSNSVESSVAFWLLFISQGALGAGLAPFITVGLTYIDDNTDPQTSALCVGIIYSLSSCGLIVGLLLGAVTTGVFVDLTPTHLTQADPEWIGAWWLGSLALAVLTFLATLPLIFFPRHLVRQDEGPALMSQALSSERMDEAKHRAAQMRPMLQRKISQLGETKIKEVPKKSKGLFNNLVFMMATLAMCCISYLPGGLFAFLPKYFETQFLVATTLANILTAIVTALAVTLGTFFGGYISARLELKIRGSVKLIFITSSVGGACFVLAMFLGCPQTLFAGSQNVHGLVPEHPCNFNCSCGLDFSPVCGTGNINHYSPCFAGCSTRRDGTEQVFGNCTCLGDSTDSVSPGFCDTGCKTLIPYSIVIFICTFCICLGQAPILAVIMRCVEPEQKALGLAIHNFLTSILGTIPAPIIYGRLIDSSCVLAEQTCGGPGRCLVYNNSTYRYIMHGITLGMIVLTMFFNCIMWLKVRNMEESDTDQSQVTNAAACREPETVPMMEENPRI